MLFGSFTEQIDVAQVVLVGFLVFFIVLVIYLRREDKREGYPLKSSGHKRYAIIGWPSPPPSKAYLLMEGGEVVLPNHHPEPELTLSSDGLVTTLAADPLFSGLGAGAFALRSEVPMRTLDGEPMLMPLRNATDWSVRRSDDDPRGMTVIGRDFIAVGVVSDLWVDRAARILRYLEVKLDGGVDTILLPIFHCEINARPGKIRIAVLKSAQLRQVPRLASPDIMTPREEDRLNAFYAGATLYADHQPSGYLR